MDAATDRRAALDRYRRHVNKSSAALVELLGAPLPERAEGNHLYDADGVRYLDCAGFGVNLIGHRHPVVIDAVKRQLDASPLVSKPLISRVTADAAQALAGVAPAGLDHVYLTNSGAEAVEVALKLARLHGRTRIIAMRDGFHGKTFGALSVTGRPAYRAPFEPLLPGVEFAEFGDIDDLAGRLATDAERSCVLLEPILGEGGVHVPPTGYLAAVRELCTRTGALLILDEIQTGLGRVGAWWAADIEDVVPDILLSGKILSGGVVPVGAGAGHRRGVPTAGRRPDVAFVHLRRQPVGRRGRGRRPVRPADRESDREVRRTRASNCPAWSAASSPSIAPAWSPRCAAADCSSEWTSPPAISPSSS